MSTHFKTMTVINLFCVNSGKTKQGNGTFQMFQQIVIEVKHFKTKLKVDRGPLKELSSLVAKSSH